MAEPDVELLVEQAFEALERGDKVRALAIADQLAAVAPRNPVVRMIRAQALMDSNNDRDALAEARQAAELMPSSAYPQLLVARAAWHVGNMELAQQSFEQAIAFSEWQPSFMAEYAWFMASARGPKLAERAAQAAIQANAASATAWAALGRAQHRLHRLDAAGESLKRALKLDPNNVCAQAAMVMLLEAKGENKQAEALADVMQDSPGTEEFVQSVHEGARMRRVHQALLEREPVRQALLGEPRANRWGLFLTVSVLVALIVAAITLAAGRSFGPAIALLPGVVLLLWRLYTLLIDR